MLPFSVDKENEDTRNEYYELESKRAQREPKLSPEVRKMHKCKHKPKIEEAFLDHRYQKSKDI